MRQTPYVLSAKMVVRDAAGRCLVLKRAQTSKNNRGQWDLPGGKVDAGETFDGALLREVAEETGLSVTLDRVVGAAESALPTRNVAYILLEGRIVDGELALSEEHEDARWCTAGEMATMDMCPQFVPFARR